MNERTVQAHTQEYSAIELLNRQITGLVIVRNYDFRHPEFITWKDSTMNLFQRLLPPDSAHLVRFRDLRFRGPVQAARRLPFNYRGPLPGPSETITAADKEAFQKACAIAEGCIKGAIEDVRYFGVRSEVTNKKMRQSAGGVQQNFHGPVTFQNQAIATDNAIQNIGQMGGSAASLKEIAALLNDSLELTGRERLDGLKAIEGIASENAKPPASRNWKSMVDCGERLMTIAGKASDVATKLAPHLPAITAWVHEAAKKL